MLPVLPVRVPATVRLAHNGELAPELLRTIGPNGGRLERSVAARCWNALYVAMAAAGFTGENGLTYTPGGTYRTLSQQVQLFLERWQLCPPDTPGARLYGGAWYELRPGVARAAVPGTSNHGLGCAVDAALGPSPSKARSLAAKTPNGLSGLDWLRAPAPAAYGRVCNAVSLGWSWESQAEPWHLHLCSASITQRVADIEHFFASMKS